MTKFVKLWQRSSFWSRIEKSFLYVGTVISGSLAIGQAAQGWIIFSTGATILGGVIGFLFNDENKDGIADIFQGNGHTIS